MTTAPDIFGGMDISTEVDEKARRAVRAFRALQPTLTAYARVLTKRRDVAVEMATRDNGSTDGKRIFYRPPIELGDDASHERRLCDRRDENRQPLCPACRIREQVLVTIYHEIAHICFDSFEKSSDEDRRNLLDAAIKEHDGKYADQIAKRIEQAPYYRKGTYVGMAGLVSEFLPMILNALEDARVNFELFRARKGTKAMFEAQINQTFNEGVEQKDLEGNIVVVKWDKYPLNAQAIVGVFCIAAGYDYTGWFTPEVEEALRDTQLTSLALRISTIRNAAGCYHLSFPVLARLRELGFCRLPDDPEEEPEPGESEDQEPADTIDPNPQSEDEPSEGSESGNNGASDEADEEPDTDEDSEGDDSSSSGDSEGSSSDQGDDAGESSSDSEGPSSGVPESSGDEPSDRDDSQDDSDARSVPGDRGQRSDSDSPGESDMAVGSDTDGDDGSDRERGAGSDQDEDEHLGGPDGVDPDEVPPTGGDEGNIGTGTPVESEGSVQSEVEGEETDDEDSGDRSDQGSPESDTSPGTEERTPDGSDTDDGKPGPEGPGDDGSLDSRASESPSGSEVGEGRAGDSPELEDDPIDTGADDGTGGIEVIENEKKDDIPVGTPEECKVALVKLGEHQEKPKTLVEVESEEAIDRAIVQGVYFETPSRNVYGVREHYYGKPLIVGSHNFSQAWDHTFGREYGLTKKQRGVTTDLEIPEAILGPALLRMRVAFADNQRGKNESHLRSGRVNPRVLGKRAPLGDDRLFRKKTLPGKKDYFVLIGMDVSGSTIGTNIALEKRAVMAQAELCHRMGIRFAILAHSGWFHSLAGRSGGLDLDIFHVKDEHEPWDSNTIQRLQELGPAQANLDGHSLEYYRKVCDRSQATDKIILYYTDGKMPAENHDEELEILQREIKTCARVGYTLLGVGIRTDSPVRHGLDTVQVEEDADLVKVVRHLEKRLK